MKKKIISFNKLKFISIGLITSFFLINSYSNGFTPQVYEPNVNELKSQGINLARTAAQLLYFGQTETANQVANMAIKLNKDNDQIWAILAETEILLKKYDKARFSLQQAQKIKPNKANYYFKEATVCFLTNDIKNSIRKIRKGLEIDPQSEDGYFQLGNAKILENNIKSALPAFNKAIELKPDFWQAINNKALVLYELNSKEQAISLWEKVLSIESDAEPILALAAARYSTGKENSESIKFAIKALSQNPNYVSEKYQKEQLWGKKLRNATKKLLKDEALVDTVNKAFVNSTIKNGSE